MTTQRLLVIASFSMMVLAAPQLRSQDPDSEREAVKAMLSDLHRAATEASLRYFDDIEPGAILYGTDAGERWTVEQFRALITPAFTAGQGWTTMATETNVFLAENGKLAWFDERLASSKWGEMRGTGVARKSEGKWRVANYNTAFVVPNRIFRDLVKLIAEQPEQKPAEVADDTEVAAEVRAVLADFHRASNEADLEGTLKHLAADAIYLATDPAERFTMKQLEEFIAPGFAQGIGWTAKPVSQHVTLSADGSVAWFDERLTSPSWGDMRGSGVLVRDAEEWKIVQFNLTLPVPNQLVPKLVEMIGK